MIEILEQTVELYERERKFRKKAVKETAPQVSQEKVPQAKIDKRQFEDKWV